MLRERQLLRKMLTLHLMPIDLVDEAMDSIMDLCIQLDDQRLIIVAEYIKDVWLVAYRIISNILYLSCNNSQQEAFRERRHLHVCDL